MKKHWKEIWGDTTDVALDHLYKKGFYLNDDETWNHQNEKYTPRPKDLDAIDFLKTFGYKGWNP